ncbi:uncharacterized protein PFLUO_LOCUS1704 [Penicillium psychrofluorescens]|uniref:uncharacterized protein n=1 Tax=Penicillium psychrofluorescens TaxID=3158075 RepID=UPI003CCD922A
MSQSPFGEAPAGIDLSESHLGRNNAAVITTYILAALAVLLRFYARLKIQQAKIAADDWMIFASLLSVTGSLICTIIGGNYGLGKHVWAVPILNVVEVVRILFIYVILYIANVPLIKLSIILFYRRIFGMTKLMWFCIFLTVGYFVSCMIAFLVCCRPVSYYWTQYVDPSGGKCVYNLYPFYIGNAAANVTTDVIILLVPIPMVWKLQMKSTQKLLISGIFMLGGFVCVASLIRIYFMTFLESSLDVTWTMGNVFIWSSVEPCIGIVCACLPTLQPLLRYTIARVFGTSRERYMNNSEPVAPALVNRKSMRRKPNKPLDWDEALLTTSAVQVEMGDVRTDGSEDGKITVNTDFRMGEEQRQGCN